ncbi:hypothetical protein MASR1M107_01810 [Ignavibacteriales bacterium]
MFKVQIYSGKKGALLSKIMEGKQKVSDASRKYDITVAAFLQWKKRLFEGAMGTFEAPVRRKPGDKQITHKQTVRRKFFAV